MKTKIFKNIIRSDVFEQLNDMVDDTNFRIVHSSFFYDEVSEIYKVVVCYYD